jgi:acyl carrier protein
MVESARAGLEELRRLVAVVLEVEPDEIEDEADFRDVFDVDSLRSIEVLARIEKRYRVDIPQSELSNMANLRGVYEVMSRCAGWPAACG